MTTERDPAREKDRLERRLARAMAQAIADFGMIAPHDRILVALSGGKDSFTMHHLLAALVRRAPIPFTLVAVNVDQGQPGYDGSAMTEYLRARGHDFRIVREDTYSIVREKVPEGKTSCSLCSRLRRAILYRIARELECSKIALGHHRDDAVVTLLLNLFFAGQLKAMPPKLLSDDRANVVIRPLIYCAEDDIARFSTLQGFPIVPCNLCGSQPNLQRKTISALLATLERQNPNLRANALNALTNVRPSHLFDVNLWRKLGLQVASDLPEETDAEGALVMPRTRADSSE